MGSSPGWSRRRAGLLAENTAWMSRSKRSQTPVPRITYRLTVRSFVGGPMWRAAVYSQWTELVAGSKIRRVHFHSLSDYIAPGESRELRVLSEALHYSQATSAIVSVHPPYYILEEEEEDKDSIATLLILVAHFLETSIPTVQCRWSVSRSCTIRLYTSSYHPVKPRTRTHSVDTTYASTAKMKRVSEFNKCLRARRLRTNHL